jgi:hypothetical protein
MAELTGLAAVVAEAGAGDALADELAPDAAVRDLLGMVLPERRVVPGRPPGRRNVRNQRIADYLLARYRDPLEGLVAMAGMGVTELAAALGCSPHEAFIEKRLCAQAALPYLHQRQPIAVDFSNTGIVQLSINTGGAGVQSTGMMISGVLHEIVENQGDDDADPGAV